MTIEKFEKGKKIYYELMDCTQILQELKQSGEIHFSILYADLYASRSSTHKANEEVRHMLIQYYEDKFTKLTKQFNEV